MSSEDFMMADGFAVLVHYPGGTSIVRTASHVPIKGEQIYNGSVITNVALSREVAEGIPIDFEVSVAERRRRFEPVALERRAS